jgi:uncharacterized protein YjdB
MPPFRRVFRAGIFFTKKKLYYKFCHFIIISYFYFLNRFVMKQLKLFLAAMLFAITSFAQPTISGPSTLCVGSTITLTGSPSGGTWASSSSSVAVVGSSSGVVTGIAAGVVVITYAGGGAIATHPVTVTPLPAPITGPSSVPVSGYITLTDATPGGTWSSSNPSVATIGPSTGVVTGVSLGTTTISYCLPSGCCVTRTITVSSALFINALSASSGDASITIYPNPAKAVATIQWDNQATGTAVVTIANIVGREVYKTQVSINATTGSAPLDLSALKDGIYILGIKSDNINYLQKLILQK